MEKIKDCLKRTKQKVKMFIAKVMWGLLENWYSTCEWCLVSEKNYSFVQNSCGGWWFRRKKVEDDLHITEKENIQESC